MLANRYEKTKFLSYIFLLMGGILTLCALSAEATMRTSIQSGPWSSPATWSGGIAPISGDSVWVVAGDSVFLDTSTAPLSLLMVQGILSVGVDTVFLNTNFSTGDTVVSIEGTLDAESGWIAVAGAASAKPIIHINGGGLFRTKASLPFDTASIYDSLSTPLFACDTTSTFEYYSDNLDLIDVSYLANNLIGHGYGNLTLRNMVASFRANPVAIRGTLHIELGASVIPSARKGQTIGYDMQHITISRDVVNDNKGESGSAGAGLHGCGMQSFATDVWTFDRVAGTSPATKDTCCWIGPSQIGSVIVRPNTVLSVRFYSDTVCDSLDILGTLTEEGGVCGGHLIGRVYSETPAILDASHPIDSFENLGLTIRSGTDPYLGRTRVVRTSGYLPPGSNAADRPVLRYFSVTPGDGPQQGTSNEMTFRFHCDESNGSEPASLHFWRSRDRGSTWAFSGRTSYDLITNSYIWDTTTVGFPNDSGSFYWMLSEGYTDIPLPVNLSSFNIQSDGSHILLEWQTASEIDAAGFEIERTALMSPSTQKLIASYQYDPGLIARSKYGGDYSYSDQLTDTGEVRYDLYEVSQNAIRMLVGSQTVMIRDKVIGPTLSGLSYHSGLLQLTLNAAGNATISVTDAIGRGIFSQEVNSDLLSAGVLTIPVNLVPGVYFVRVDVKNAHIVQKMAVFGG